MLLRPEFSSPKSRKALAECSGVLPEAANSCSSYQAYAAETIGLECLLRIDEGRPQPISTATISSTRMDHVAAA